MVVRQFVAPALALAFFLSWPVLSQDVAPAAAKEYGSPARFEAEIKKYEAADQVQLPPRNAIVCYGSSTMRLWGPHLAEDLAPLTVVPRGFGGSNMNDALFFLDRLVIPYHPRAILLYEGDNDIGQGIAPAQVVAVFKQLVAKVHEQLPQARIYVLAIKPSILRWKLLPQMEEANKGLQQVCAADPLLTFIDAGHSLLDANGEPRPELYQKDKLHMTRAGYLLWRDAVRPILLAHEQANEAPAAAAPAAAPTAPTTPAAK